MHRILDTLTQVQTRINDAAKQYQRNADEITLLGVSKKQPVGRIREAFEAGISHIGENYLQEALEKQQQLKDLNICWHFIGPIQSNKTRAIAEHFDWVHSIDRLKIAQRLNDQRPDALPPLNICLQVNIDNENSKAGVLPEHVETLAADILRLPKLTLRGLMVIPKHRSEQVDQHKVFARTRALLESVASTLHSDIHSSCNTVKFDTLSMGMSADLDAAVAEGATIVRIGTSLFGARS